VIHCKCCNNNLSQTQATASPVQQITHITNKPCFLCPVKHMLEQPWGLAVSKWEHHFITVHSRFLKYDIPTYETNQSYNQNFLKKISIQTNIKMSLKFHVDLCLNCTHTVLIVTTGMMSVLIILQQKDYLFESPSTCWRVYIPPHFLFCTYNRVYGTYPVCKWGSTCMWRKLNEWELGKTVLFLMQKMF